MRGGRSFLFLLGLLAGPAVAQAVHDYENLPEARSLMTPQKLLGSLPKRIDGSPDWVRALDLQLIAPRSTRSGASRPEEAVAMPKDGMVFTNTLFMPHVVFPHRQHAEWLTCMNCHEFLFEMKATGRGQGMTAIFQGRHCGFCHGRVAFSPEGSCYRCHSKENPNAAKASSPFVEPKTVEAGAPAASNAPSVPVVAEEVKKPRRGARQSTWTSGRLTPSVVPPPAETPPPPAPGETPQLN